MAPAAEGLVLGAAADLVEAVVGQPDHMERIRGLDRMRDGRVVGGPVRAPSRGSLASSISTPPNPAITSHMRLCLTLHRGPPLSGSVSASGYGGPHPDPADSPTPLIPPLPPHFPKSRFSRSCRVRVGGWGLEQGVRRKTVRVCAVLRFSARRPGVTSGAAGRIRAARWLVHPDPGPGSAGGCCGSREGFGCGGWCTLCKTARGKRMTRIGVLLLFRRRGRRPAARARRAEPPTVACAGAPPGALSAHVLSARALPAARRYIHRSGAVRMNGPGRLRGRTPGRRTR